MSKDGKTSETYHFSDFLSMQKPSLVPCLMQLHQVISSMVPNAQENLSYQVHCFKHIYMLVGIGTTKQYCSLYTMSSKLVKEIKGELKNCKISGTTLHFNPAEPLPVDIITRIVLARVQENEAIAMSRKKA